MSILPLANFKGSCVDKTNEYTRTLPITFQHLAILPVFHISVTN